MTTAPRPVPGAPSAFRLAPRVRMRLDNGMRATLVSAGVVPTAAVRLVLRTGSADVPEGQTWLDRFIHDYLREGTEAHDASGLADAFAALGGRFAVDADEHTTVLRTDVLAEGAPAAIGLLAEIARRSTFPASEADRLRADLRRSLDLVLAQPQFVTYQAFRAALYDGHPYGRLAPPPEVVDAFDPAAARSFWLGETGAHRAHLLVGGRFDEAAVTVALREAFEDWEPGPEPAHRPPEMRRGRSLHLVDRPGAEQSTLYIGVGVPAPTHEDYVPLEVTNFLLGGSFHSRITMNIREEKGYTYSPFSAVSSRPRDAFWVETADVTTEVTGAALDEIVAEIEGLRAEPPNVEELEGIQNFAAGSFVMRQATPGTILDHLEFLDLHGLDESYSERYVERVRAVTPDLVRDMAARYLPSAEMTIAIAGDRSRIDGQVARFGAVEG
ncbi:MAG: pitrilysin family protein [Dehalococcoidia bacterium]